MAESGVINLHEIFYLIDKQRKGTVPANRVGDLLRFSGLNPTEKVCLQIQQKLEKPILSVEEFIEIYNENHESSLEFKSIRNPERVGNQFKDAMINAMRTFDHRGSGFISLNELKSILTGMGDQLSDGDFEELRQFMEITSSGQISYERLFSNEVKTGLRAHALEAIMIPISAISSAVTAFTVSAFIFIARNMQEKDSENSEEKRLTNEALSAAIIAELESETSSDSNEIDYELLEEKFKVLEAEESSKYNEEPLEAKASDMNEIPVEEKSVPVEGFDSFEGKADLFIEASHSLKNAGQHRSYTLSVHFSPNERAEDKASIPWQHCRLHVEWPLPKTVFVDVWALRRISGFTVDNYSSHVLSPSGISAGYPFWSVKPRHPDLEVGSYDPKAKPFILIAEVPFRVEKELTAGLRIADGKLYNPNSPWSLDLHVPDVFVRYQTAARGSLFESQKSKISYLPAPNLNFKCQAPESDSNPDSIQVEWHSNRLRPLQISLPIGSANHHVPHVTIASILISSLFLLISLSKF